jgi:hypothetical protein
MMAGTQDRLEFLAYLHGFSRRQTFAKAVTSRRSHSRL